MQQTKLKLSYNDVKRQIIRLEHFPCTGSRNKTNSESPTRARSYVDKGKIVADLLAAVEADSLRFSHEIIQFS